MFASLMPDLIRIDAGPAESVRLASRAGFRGVDLRLNRFADEVDRLDPAVLSAAFDAAGLRPGYCSITPGSISVGEEQWRAAMEDVPRRARLAAALGYTRATAVVLPFSTDLDPAANRARHIERTREAADALEPHGLRFGLEYVSPLTRRRDAPHQFVHTLAQLLELLDEAGRPNTGVMLDCFHWHCAGETADDLAAIGPQRVIAVHVCDLVPGVPVDEQVVTERELPAASGIVDIATFLGTLRDIGYDGPVTAEPTSERWFGRDAAESARETADAVRRAMQLAGVPTAAAAPSEGAP